MYELFRLFVLIFMPFIVVFYGLCLVIFSCRAKEDKEIKTILDMSICIPIVYFILSYNMLGGHLEGWGCMFVSASIPLTITFYLVSIIICICKAKGRLNGYINPIRVVFVVVLLLGCGFSIQKYKKQDYEAKDLIRQSELVVIVHDSGNGGIGEGKDYVYIIVDDELVQSKLKGDSASGLMYGNNAILKKSHYSRYSEERKNYSTDYSARLDKHELQIFYNGELQYTAYVPGTNLEITDVYYKK